MVEHLLLMSAIPMLLYGLPVVPMLRGVPRPVLRWVAGPLIRVTTLRRVAHWLVTPAVASVAMNVAYLGRHAPAAYDLALENETWHGVEHLCFLVTSLLFWWYIMRPWPAKQRRGEWMMLIYLALADVVMTLLSAFLAFCDRPVYPYYVSHPNPFHIPALDDQVCVPGAGDGDYAAAGGDWPIEQGGVAVGATPSPSPHTFRFKVFY